MNCLRVLFVVAVAVAVTGAASSRREWMAHKAVLIKSPEFQQEVRKRANEASEGALQCFGCRNTDPSSTSCEGKLETCRPGEVCATVWHDDNTNLDGCLARTICEQLEQAEGIYASCCDSYLCNLNF